MRTSPHPVTLTLIVGSLMVVVPRSGLATGLPRPGGVVSNNRVDAMARAPDGSLYLGGAFTYIGPMTGAFVKVSTSGAGAVTVPIQVDGGVETAAPDGAGGWYIGGGFTHVGGIEHPYLAHVRADGSLDEAWNPAPDQWVYAIVVAGSEVYFAGNFQTVHGGALVRHHLAKTTIGGKGVVDPLWDPSPDGVVYALALSATDVFFGGGFFTVNDGATSRDCLAKTPKVGDGTVDPTWDPYPNGIVEALALSGTDLYFAGWFAAVNGNTTHRYLARTATTGNGTPDPTWKPDPDGAVSALALAGSEVYFGGEFGTVNGGGTARARLAKTATTGNGTVDPTWNPTADGMVRTLAVAGTSVFFGGDFTTVNGGTLRRGYLAKAASTGAGTIDATWNPNAGSPISTIVAAGADVFVGGYLESVGGLNRNYLARLRPDGTLDPVWDPDVNDYVFALALSDAHVYFGGRFHTANHGAVVRNNLARAATTGDGTVDALWDPNPDAHVVAIVTADTDVYYGGGFTTVSGASHPYLAKSPMIGSGAAAAGWNPRPNGGVETLAVAGGQLFFGGAFTSVNNGANAIAALAMVPLADPGTVDPTWNPNPNGTVRAVAVGAFDLYFGGHFTTVNGGTPRNRLAKVPQSGNGVVDPLWNPNVDGTVLTLMVSGEEVYMGGMFGYANGGAARRPYVARTGTTGAGAVDEWSPSASAYVASFADLGGDVAFGGIFTKVKGRYRTGYARIANTSVLVLPEPPGPTCIAGGSTFLLDVGAGEMERTTVCDGSNGKSSSVVVSDEPAGSHCAAGGKRIDIIETTVPISTSYVCNGVTGDGASVLVTDEAAGANCASGGKRVDTSVGSGAVITSYVCNGTPGTTLMTVAEPAGANCASGGVKITGSGADRYVCNGGRGFDALVDLAAEPAGGNCTHGGVSIKSGQDRDGDGKLATAEVTKTEYACDGASGGCSCDGAAGAPGWLMPPVFALLLLLRRRRVAMHA